VRVSAAATARRGRGAHRTSQSDLDLDRGSGAEAQHAARRRGGDLASVVTDAVARTVDS
jgi:hypothetical protein